MPKFEIKWEADDLTADAYNAIYDGFDKWMNPPNHSCSHVWLKYSGFTDTYHYCEKCDAKMLDNGTITNGRATDK